MISDYGQYIISIDDPRPIANAVEGSDDRLQYSPDKTRVAYGGEEGLFLIDLLTEVEIQVASDTLSYIDWSPDGSRIAFGTDQGLFVAEPSGEKQVQITGESISFRLPSWSPDSQWLTYRAGDGFYLAKADGSRTTTIEVRPPADSPNADWTVWKDSGTHLIYYWYYGWHDPIHVRITDTDIELTDPVALDGSLTVTQPALHTSDDDSMSSDLWSANGRYMVDEEPDGGLVLVDASDGTQIRVSDNVASGFAWSPHGDHFAFQDAGSLCVGKPQAFRCQRVADSLHVGAARWAPDSSQVAFAGQDGIVVVDADTQEWVQFDITNVENFDWSQNSTQIAYSVYPNPREPGILYVSDADSNNPTPIAILETEPIASYVGWLGDDRHIIYGAQYYWDHE